MQIPHTTSTVCGSICHMASTADPPEQSRNSCDRGLRAYGHAFEDAGHVVEYTPVDEHSSLSQKSLDEFRLHALGASVQALERRVADCEASAKLRVDIVSEIDHHDVFSAITPSLDVGSQIQAQRLGNFHASGFQRGCIDQLRTTLACLEKNQLILQKNIVDLSREFDTIRHNIFGKSALEAAWSSVALPSENSKQAARQSNRQVFKKQPNEAISTKEFVSVKSFIQQLEREPLDVRFERIRSEIALMLEERLATLDLQLESRWLPSSQVIRSDQQRLEQNLHDHRDDQQCKYEALKLRVSGLEHRFVKFGDLAPLAPVKLPHTPRRDLTA